MTREPRRFLRHPAVAMASAVLCAGMATSSPIAFATSADLAAQERRVAELTRQLEQAKRELAAARKETAEAQTRAEEAEAALERSGAAEASDIELGPLTIGGAIRANYTSAATREAATARRAVATEETSSSTPSESTRPSTGTT